MSNGEQQSGKTSSNALDWLEHEYIDDPHKVAISLSMALVGGGFAFAGFSGVFSSMRAAGPSDAALRYLFVGIFLIFAASALLLHWTDREQLEADHGQ